MTGINDTMSDEIPQPSGERPDGTAVRRDDPCKGTPAPTAAADASALRHGHNCEEGVCWAEPLIEACNYWKGETERLRAQVLALENDGMETAAKLGEAEHALHEAIRLARLFNRGAMTWREYDRKLAALEGSS